MVNFSCRPSILVFRTTTTRLPCGMYIHQIVHMWIMCSQEVIIKVLLILVTIIERRDLHGTLRSTTILTWSNVMCSPQGNFLLMWDVYSPNWTYVNNVLARSIINPRDNNRKERAWLFKKHNDSHIIQCNVSTIRKFLLT